MRDWSMGGGKGSRYRLVHSPAVANIKSQIKRNRQNEVRRVRNKAVRSALKTSAKGVREAAGQGDGDQTQQLLRAAARDLDKAASKGAVHKRAAARRKSRLARNAARTPSS
jgi:small subunit ribosomal protein S20